MSGEGFEKPDSVNVLCVQPEKEISNVKAKTKTRDNTKQWGATLKPGDIEGKRGCTVRRLEINDWVALQHLNEQGAVVGIECVSSKAHWWLDTEIQRPPLRNEDWAMAAYFSSREHRLERWQLPWAWDYECWREWQPWSDFDRWREKFLEEVERLRTSIKLSRAESEGTASVFGDFRLPSWMMRGFASFLPETPWIAIPNKDREKLLAKTGIKRGSRYNSPPSLEGSVSALKRLPPNTKPWIPGDDEALRAHSEWMAAPGYYNEERVDEYTRGHFSGTYVIHVPWRYPDDTLRAAFEVWLERHKPKGCRICSDKGTTRQLRWLQQLGALRLLREMTVEKAIARTRILPSRGDEGGSLYSAASHWSRAKRCVDRLLARRYGMA